MLLQDLREKDRKRVKFKKIRGKNKGNNISKGKQLEMLEHNRSRPTYLEQLLFFAFSGHTRVLFFFFFFLNVASLILVDL